MDRRAIWDLAWAQGPFKIIVSTRHGAEMPDGPGMYPLEIYPHRTHDLVADDWGVRGVIVYDGVRIEVAWPWEAVGIIHALDRSWGMSWVLPHATAEDEAAPSIRSIAPEPGGDFPTDDTPPRGLKLVH